MYDNGPRVRVYTHSILDDPDAFSLQLSNSYDDFAISMTTFAAPGFEADTHTPHQTAPDIVHTLPPLVKHVPPVRVGRAYRRRKMKKNSRVNKHCERSGCGNISVSRGLCRSHGGGRRCHFPECTKSAQSRSMFCWGHGGGRRCEVEGCMRSRKSKRYCVDHVNQENATATDSATVNAIPTSSSLPSLQEALQNAQRSDVKIASW
ncbi:hypothetical protein V7S43_012664 [Phytophthora oleae]|uniref:WRKY19-like zinc finger domain-containing protein n=1 Tax=Phytophthora oleae TaxID=2107226 RepID=A0ABD3F7A7_9STRA